MINPDTVSIPVDSMAGGFQLLSTSDLKLREGNLSQQALVIAEIDSLSRENIPEGYEFAYLVYAPIMIFAMYRKV